MRDHEIIELYWARNESAIAATAEKYGSYCHTIAYNILRNKEDAEECSNDMYLSIDRAVDKLESQVRRYRTKLDKRIRSSEVEPVAEAMPEYQEASYDVVRTKKFAVKPMSVEDAITQMELLGHNFFLFLNEETDTMCVLYRRNDDSYGLLQPEM